jgi:hypothetical protein
MNGFKPEKHDASIRMSDSAKAEIDNRRLPQHRKLRWVEVPTTLKDYPERKLWVLPDRRRSRTGSSLSGRKRRES